jgi:antitoxin (DNA-binding transcriptional repressor) of toxin-antitoxin stability system
MTRRSVITATAWSCCTRAALRVAWLRAIQHFSAEVRMTMRARFVSVSRSRSCTGRTTSTRSLYSTRLAGRHADVPLVTSAASTAGRAWVTSFVLAPRLPRGYGVRPGGLAASYRCAMYVEYATGMSEDALPLPYEVQEMTTTEARKHLPDLVNMAAYGHVTTVLVRDGRRLARIVPEEDAWIYSPAWQEKLREAEADITAGRVQRFDSDDAFLAHLDETG